MKRLYFIFIFAFICVSALCASAQQINSAVRVDGINNDLAIGCPIIEAPYSLELWYKHDSAIPFNEKEVFFPGVEIQSVDYRPLMLVNGVLSSPARGLEAPDSDTPGWHHVALVCDGERTFLYFDGEMVAEKDSSAAILPTGINCAYGVKENNMFHGDIDEVRIWKTALRGNTIRKWMCRDIEPSHPDFRHLFAYYNFDDGLKESGVNPMGTGHQSHHIRNGKNNAYLENDQLAFTVPNDNPKVKPYPMGRQKLFNAVVIESEWDVQQGASDDQILKLRLRIRGNGRAMKFKSLKLKQKGEYIPQTVKIWDAGCWPDCDSPALLAIGKTSKHRIRIPGELTLKSGINYILVTADIPGDAPIGKSIRMEVRSFRSGLFSHKAKTTDETLPKRIIPSNKENILNVLQWNIWHGGRHLGPTGPDRVAELIKASGAEIVTLQEGYGSQDYIAGLLGMNCHTCSPKANLALLTPYPIVNLETEMPFNSNPLFVNLPSGNKILVNDLWLRYASKHCYTENYIDPDQNTEDWIEEDIELGQEDLRRIIENDTNPYVSEDTDIILAGDFNSCSHLDWTDPSLHRGYGPVAFPISRFAVSNGYSDSFREANPDEKLRPEGTWAVILGHLQECRIDYIYHKGPHLHTVSSKIIRTAPQIDDVWPSDHAVVHTLFEIQ